MAEQNENFDVASIFGEETENTASQSKQETSELYLEALQIVGIQNGRRTILDTIKVEKGVDPTKRVLERAKLLSQHQAVMVVQKWECVVGSFEKDSNASPTPQRYIPHNVKRQRRLL